ncbi:MAG: hypothetical protein K6F35_04235 [Lachnospiraceae bacterium]|nr:hypothetical protein [Lachnospiraceae bacterium]
MNAFLNKLERKIGRYAIPQLTKFVVLTYIIGYILYFMSYLNINILPMIYLSPRLILRGQVWRLVTWVLMPPSAPNLFTVIMLFFYYQIGSALEQTWGDFKYNLYIFSGLLFMEIGAFVLYAFGTSVDGMFTTYYVNMSIFLAFAACYPNMQVYLYFLIPLKIKYLAYIDVAFLAWSAISASTPERMAIIFSMLNFVIFFFTSRNYHSSSQRRASAGQEFRRAYYERQARRRQGSNPDPGPAFRGSSDIPGGDRVNYHAGETIPKGKITKHKCAICGRTELDGEHLEFRFCSKCDGNYEYCQEHLFTHQHIKYGSK